jgi:hypothetical protein
MKVEPISRERILAELLLDQSRQRIETLAHVRRQRAQKHSTWQRQTQHAGSSNGRTIANAELRALPSLHEIKPTRLLAGIRT